MKIIWVVIFGVCTFGLSLKDDFTKKELPIQSFKEQRDHNILKQSLDYSCGAGSLGTILKYYYNQELDEKTLVGKLLAIKGIDINDPKALEYNDDFVGFSFADLQKVGLDYDFKAMGFMVGFDNLKELKIPAILFVRVRKHDHFTVFKTMDEQFVYLSDPGNGNMKVSHTRFKEMFLTDGDKGRILVFIPNDKSQPINEAFKNIPTYDMENIIETHRFEGL